MKSLIGSIPISSATSSCSPGLRPTPLMPALSVTPQKSVVRAIERTEAVRAIERVAELVELPAAERAAEAGPARPSLEPRSALN
eukprot:6117615-Heterocapsa_arctica.AAC.1